MTIRSYGHFIKTAGAQYSEVLSGCSGVGELPTRRPKPTTPE